MSDLDDELSAVREKIQDVIDLLDDIAFRQLRIAVARKETKRPEVEKRVTRARNSLLRVLPMLQVSEMTVDDPE